MVNARTRFQYELVDIALLRLLQFLIDYWWKPSHVLIIILSGISLPRFSTRKSPDLLRMICRRGNGRDRITFVYWTFGWYIPKMIQSNRNEIVCFLAEIYCMIRVWIVDQMSDFEHVASVWQNHCRRNWKIDSYMVLSTRRITVDHYGIASNIDYPIQNFPLDKFRRQ